MASLRSLLPDFPWDSLAPYKQRAAEHEGGIVDLSVGTPVDPVPTPIRRALAEHADAPGYPQVIGIPALRDAMASFLVRERGAVELDASHVVPTIGSKELVCHLPFQLGLGPGDAVALPHIAYPTYDMGARFARAVPVPVDLRALARDGDAAFSDPATAASVRLLWLNSPSNPTGDVLEAPVMRDIVRWARRRGVVVASDECYALLPWTVERVPSVLDPEVNDGDLTGLLCAYSLSKQANMAGYRAAFLAGDPALIDDLVQVRKQAGMMLPTPVQHAMVAALGDASVTSGQREVYRRRRDLLAGAVTDAGGRIDDSRAGLYLWTTWGRPALESVARLAEAGILVAPGTFYGDAGALHVRIALTATDERIGAAAQRLRTIDG